MKVLEIVLTAELKEQLKAFLPEMNNLDPTQEYTLSVQTLNEDISIDISAKGNPDDGEPDEDYGGTRPPGGRP